MTDAQKQICNELISHARDKKEVEAAMKVTFPKIQKVILKQYVSTAWKEHSQKKRISLRNTEYKDKYIILTSLLHKKEIGEIREIQLTLTKNLIKGMNSSDYQSIIGLSNMQAEKREEQRGRKVKLISFSPDYTKIIVEATNWKHMQYYFTIWDISGRSLIEIK